MDEKEKQDFTTCKHFGTYDPYCCDITSMPWMRLDCEECEHYEEKDDSK